MSYQSSLSLIRFIPTVAANSVEFWYPCWCRISLSINRIAIDLEKGLVGILLQTFSADTDDLYNGSMFPHFNVSGFRGLLFV